MIVIGLLTMAPVAAVGRQVTGDFDGNGRPDTASIFQQPNGRRDVVVELNDGPRELLYARVDEHSVLSVISPVEIARLCKPFARAVPDCSPTFSHRDRDGLSFKPTVEQVPALALWNGTRFSLQSSTWSPQGEPPAAALRSATASSPAANLPCKLKDQRGRLVEMTPRFCEAVPIYVKQPAQPNEFSPHTTLQVEVSEAGTVENCRVIEPSGTPELDTKACTIATARARYAPTSAGSSIKQQTRRIRITWPKAGELVAVSEVIAKTAK
jgi:TonB family protein